MVDIRLGKWGPGQRHLHAFDSGRVLELLYQVAVIRIHDDNPDASASQLCGGHSHQVRQARIGIGQVESSGRHATAVTARGCARWREDYCLDLVECRADHDRCRDGKRHLKIATRCSVA